MNKYYETRESEEKYEQVLAVKEKWIEWNCNANEEMEDEEIKEHQFLVTQSNVLISEKLKED